MLGVPVAGLTLAIGAGAHAGSESTVSPLVVTAPTPLGAAMPLTDLPLAGATLDAADLSVDGPPSVLRGLDEHIASLALDQAQGNSLQPNLLFRGFEASPLAGDAQGLAVYVGGVRFNQPFGDTVNWDLIPDIAVDRIDLVSSDPVFGLNALGGALSVALKDGFSADASTVELSGGSFGRMEGSIEARRRAGASALYVAIQGFHEDGWRQSSPSNAGQLYADYGLRFPGGGAFHINVLAADTDLTGLGTTPVQLLAIDRAAIFTSPDKTFDKFLRLAATAEIPVARSTVLKAEAFGALFDQASLNGDAADAQPCAANPSVVCDQAGEVLTDTQFRPIADFVTNSPYVSSFPQYADGGPYSTLNTTSTRTTSYGAALQITDSRGVGVLRSHAVAGVSYDGATTWFGASTALGALSLARGYVGPGVTMELADGSIAPVSVRTLNNTLGVFVGEILDLPRGVSLSASARYNAAWVTLRDRLGTTLNGDHGFSRIDPAAGVVWRIDPGLSAYAGYAEANRAPSPAELSCASPLAPCSLTNFFVGDPDLRQVVARTIEAGFRGHWNAARVRLNWRAGIYRETSDNDIQFVASPTLERDYFTNVGQTRRQGVEAGIDGSSGPVSLFVDYAYTDATYRTPLTLDSGGNPAADAGGLIFVHPGDRVPSVPVSNLKVGLAWRVRGGWRFDVGGRHSGSQYLAGDAANLTPPIPGYWLVNLGVRVQATRRLSIFARVENVTNTRYATFGDFSPTALTPIVQAPTATDPRSLAPGQPVAAFAGLSLEF